MPSKKKTKSRKAGAKSPPKKQTKKTPKRGTGAATRAKPENKRAIFIFTLARTGVVGVACAAAQIARGTAYAWRDERGPEGKLTPEAEAFREAWDAALEDSTDLLEEEAFVRAHDGRSKPVFFMGDQCGVIQVYSDRMLECLLKARRPEKFRERSSIEHSGPGGGPIPVDLMNQRRKAAEDLEAFERGAGGSDEPKPL